MYVESLKHQKTTSRLYFTVFLGKVSFPVFRNQGRYATLDPGPFEEWGKYDRGTKNKKQANMLQNLGEIVLSIKYSDLIFNSNQWWTPFSW